MAITFLTAQQRLARLMGDATSAGTALYAKWSQQEYKDAINFAIDLIRERFLLPSVTVLTWAAGTYDYSPGTMVYLHDAYAESQTSPWGGQSPSVGTGLFEYAVPLGLITVKRDASSVLYLHFDKNSIIRHYLDQTSLKVRLYGYRYQTSELSADADSLDINFSTVVLIAKQYLHLAGAGRDPSDLMKHLRQWQAVAAQIASNADDDFERPGGIWLEH